MRIAIVAGVVVTSVLLGLAAITGALQFYVFGFGFPMVYGIVLFGLYARRHQESDADEEEWARAIK
jgi:hypothetical protein